VCGYNHIRAVLLPVKETKVSVLYDASSALEQVLMLTGEQKNLFSTPQIEYNSLVSSP
jgi:hypothetical protein